MNDPLLNILLVLPLGLPLLCAIIGLFGMRHERLQYAVGTLGAAASCAAAFVVLAVVWQRGIITTDLGGWPAPYGITLVADLFSAVMLCLAGTMGVVVAVFACADIQRARIRHGFFVFYHVLLMGVNGAFLSGDLFNMYVWFEVMLMASFVLMVLGGEPGQTEAGVKYVALSLFASMLFLASIGILYAQVGTLNFAHLALILQEHDQPRLVSAVALLLLCAFGIKAALFPLYFWLPASYHTPPPAVTAIFAALLTKVGMYAMVRVFTLVFAFEGPLLRTVLLWIAAFTMVSGVLGALAQTDVRRLLSFHIISQMGYLALGLALALGTQSAGAAQLALASVLFFTVHVAAAKAALFLVSGVAFRMRGTYQLKNLGGLYAEAPFLALLFFTAAMALAGVPPLSGFAAKYGVLRAGLSAGAYWPVAAAVAVSLVTLLSMTKIWDQAFWKPLPEDAPPSTAIPGRFTAPALYGPIIALAVFCVVMGLAAESFFAVALRAASDLLDPTAYIKAVLEGRL
jgi:multicomponent Na+:H+ antiporter subunit D